MVEEKLNSLVESFRKGDDRALEQLCELFLPIIYKHSESIWYKIESFTDFECRCILKIKKALENFEPSKGKVYNLVINVIQREKFDFLSRRKRKLGVISLDEPLYRDKDGKEVLADLPDETANFERYIESEEAVKEKIAFLAKGDQKKEFVLKAWASGETNVSEIARTLARLYPDTTFDSHRKFVHRFREECEKRLAAV